MPLKIAAIVNANAKQNKSNSAKKEARKLERILDFSDAKVDLTGKADIVKNLCDDYMKEKTDIVILSGGDGTVQNFLTTFFKQAYKEFGRGQTPIEFARTLNRASLEQATKIHLPKIYHRRRGTVNVYADTLKMTGEMEQVAQNLYETKRFGNKNPTHLFERAYVPILMLYPKDKPDDLESIQLMSLYADASLYRFFEEYYKPKDRGGECSMMTAATIIARCAGSITLSKIVDGISSASAFQKLKTAYENRYVDEILASISCEVIIDDATRMTERNATAMGTLGASLYGIKPFWRMPSKPQDFSPFYKAGTAERARDFSYEKISGKRFQFIGGKPDPFEIVKALPKLYLGNETCISGMEDTLANRVEITQDENLKIIADGSRHSNGKRAVIEVAYLQPFIMLDKNPRLA